MESVGKVEVAVVVAVKCEATVSPTTDNFAYGEVVPMPTRPLFSTKSFTLPVSRVIRSVPSL